MKKLLMAAAVGALALGGAIGEAIAQAKDSIIIVMRLEPAPGLDPTMGAASAIGEVTSYNVFENLVRMDERGKIHPMLAEKWTISEDGKVYVFDLVKGVKYHDNTDFDSADVKFNFTRNAGEKSSNKDKAFFAAIAAIDTPDKHRVVITLKEPNSLFLFKLAQAPSSLANEEASATIGTAPVGTGPYKFVKWTKGDSVELEKFAGHRDAAKIKINKVKFRFITDEAAQVAALLAGDVDYITNVAAESVEQLKKDAKIQVTVGTTEGETILAMNNKHPALSDVRVRRAIMHAIDRKSVIDGAQAGFGTPIGAPFAPHHPAYIDLTGQSPYDSAKAKALLKEAGQEGKLELTMKLPPPSYARKGGEIIAAMLGQVGIKTKIENVEFAQWLDAVFKQKQYDLTIISHVEPMDIINYTNPNYYWQYDSQEFRDLYKKFELSVSEADQTKYLQDMQRKLATDMVNGYLFEFAKLGAAKKGLTGLWLNAPAFINHVAAMAWQ
ncbi:MAG: ABC transporter substrate-binding protein [Alphaproteobacteria bacterium]|nr:ABC transporter substrate-binding protein [Alphaproteobacteria bacterium]